MRNHWLGGEERNPWLKGKSKKINACGIPCEGH